MLFGCRFYFWIGCRIPQDDSQNLQTDLSIHNVQLSLFSFPSALAPDFFMHWQFTIGYDTGKGLFNNFGTQAKAAGVGWIADC